MTAKRDATGKGNIIFLKYAGYILFQLTRYHMNATIQSNSHCGTQISDDEVYEACGIRGTNEKCFQILAMQPERKVPGRPRCR